jgi:hypothetical protein
MLTCGIDPGAPPKTVFAHNGFGHGSWSHSTKWMTERRPPCSVFTLAIAEKPAGVIRANRTPASVVSPAGWGMAALFSVEAEMRCWVPVEDWKRKLLGSAWNMKKEVACASFVQMFKLTGLDPKNESDQDVIDAIAIGEAGALFTRRELKKWIVKW